MGRPQQLPLLLMAVVVSALLLAAGSHGWRQAALALVGVLFG
ncbi:MAG: YeeE/YedE family protein, partial [Synechococcaceae bacterium WB9_2_170]|nr:YeeE/YedE family protein [Synechococcaceae bacterium WB9_2_170]